MNCRFPALVSTVLAAFSVSVAGAETSGPPMPVSPGSSEAASLVASQCPTFSWGVVGEPQAIELVIYRLALDDEEALEADSEAAFGVTLPGTAATWTLPGDRCLEPGDRYAWSARTWVEDAPSAWAEPSFFRIVGSPSVEELRQAFEVVQRFLGDESELAAIEKAAPAGPGVTAVAEEAAPGRAATAPVPLSPGSAGAIQVDGLGVVTEAAMVLSAHGLRVATAGLNDPQVSELGDDLTMDVTMPFGVEIAGTIYSALTISSNGWVEFGGDTSGHTDFSNDCLPTPVHTNPFLAAYWDDLRLEAGMTAGWTGDAPNRAYVIQWYTHPLSDPIETVAFQVQILEGSSLINVTYSSLPLGSTQFEATVGFQGAGAGAAAPYPIMCNGSLLFPAGPGAGWSIAPVR